MSPAMKNDRDNEREQSLVEQWVSLTEERNAVSKLIKCLFFIQNGFIPQYLRDILSFVV